MRVWHAFGTKPPEEKTFKLSIDPLFVDKMHDIVRPYHSTEFLAFLREINASVPANMPIHIMDTMRSTTPKRLEHGLHARLRYHTHFTPTSTFWLNLVERFLSMLSEKWIKQQSHVSVKDLEASIKHCLETYNQNPKPFRWHF